MKSFSKLAVPILLISAFGVCYSEFNSLLRHEVNYLNPLINWLKGRPYYHLWYVYTLLGIYLMVPALVYIRTNLRREQYRLLGVAWFTASCVSCLFCDFELAWGVHTVSCFASWLVIGDLIGNSEKKANPWLCLGIGEMMLFLTGAWEAYQNHLIDGSAVEKILGYINASNNFSPTVILASTAIFAGFGNIRLKRNFSTAASKTFAIYLVHAFLIDIVVKLYNFLIGSTPNPWIWFPICTMIVFVASYFGTYLFESVVRIMHRWCADRKNRR